MAFNAQHLTAVGVQGWSSDQHQHHLLKLVRNADSQAPPESPESETGEGKTND